MYLPPTAHLFLDKLYRAWPKHLQVHALLKDSDEHVMISQLALGVTQA